MLDTSTPCSLCAHERALVDRPAGPPPLGEVLALPRTFEAIVEPRFIDPMGHMNVAWYVHLFDRATWVLLAKIGLDQVYMDSTGAGAFAVEQKLNYYTELRLHDRLDIHSRITEVGRKTIRFMHAMVDLERRQVAATSAYVGVHVDRRTRRAIQLPEAHVRSAERLIRV